VEIDDIGGGVVRQGVGLEVAPEEFDGIEVGRVGRQELQVKVVDARQVAADGGAVMRPEAIPDHDEGALELPAQVAEEAEHLDRGDVGVGVQCEVEADAAAVRGEGEGRDGGDLAMAAGALGEEGRVPARGPGAADDGGHQEAALVDEDEAGVQGAGFFLMRGSSTRNQRRMPASSRSRARRSGFWGLQPRRRSSRPR